MVIKVYVSLISCSQEVKKNQQRALMILESKNISYTLIDITDPSNEDSKEYMLETANAKEGTKMPFTPQIYNEADYCGDFDGLDMANETDTLGDFLKLSDEEKKAIKIGICGIITPEKGEKESENIKENEQAAKENLSNGVQLADESQENIEFPQENLENSQENVEISQENTVIPEEIIEIPQEITEASQEDMEMPQEIEEISQEVAADKSEEFSGDGILVNDPTTDTETDIAAEE